MSVPAIGSRLRVRAPAKVNLTLRILERLPSGFHTLETLFQAIDLCDTLEVEVRREPGVTLEVVGADVGPADDNLVVRAARAWLAETGVEWGLAVRLTKVIPAGAGLGGGSSDAGAMLRALDHWMPEAVAPERRLAIGAELGSDVPFFTGKGGLVLGRGRGERMTPLPPLPTAWLVVGMPPVHVATGPAYGRLAHGRAESGRAVPPPLFDGEGGVPRSWPEVASVALNDFEPVVAGAHPAIAAALAAIRAQHPAFALLSGSGAAVFGLFTDAAAAERAVGEARSACPESRFELARTLDRLPAVEPAGP